MGKILLKLRLIFIKLCSELIKILTYFRQKHKISKTHQEASVPKVPKFQKNKRFQFQTISKVPVPSW